VAGVAVHRALDTREEVVLSLPEPSYELASLRAIPFQIASPAARFALLVFERAQTLPSSVPYEDASRIQQLELELDGARRSLQAAIEELETSNEELQATNEELMASNEELQATNEELQSVNEELHTVNVEHQARISDLSETLADLDNLLNATPVATLFLDDKLRIRRFNPPVEKLFSVVDSDRGRPLASFTSRLRDIDLLPELEKVRAQASTFERELETTDGARYIVRAVPHVGPGRRLCGVVLTLSDVTTLHATRAAHERLQSVLDGLPPHIAVLDEHGTIELVNFAWTRFAGANGGSGSALSVGVNYLDACRETPDIRSGLEAVLAGRLPSFRCEYPCHTPTEKRWFVMDVARSGPDGVVVVAHTDVTRTHTQEEGDA
jgi:two-component system CheB/CheR fusion protein